MTPEDAYEYAYDHHMDPGFDLNHYQEIACKSPDQAFSFAKNIPGANVEYCQEFACKSARMAYYFARDIPGADIEYCQKHVYKKPWWTYYFARDIPGANILQCYDVCKHNHESVNLFNVLIIKKCLL